MAKNLILIKLGGSIITDKNKPFTARPSVIRRLAQKIKREFKLSANHLIIGHGGGSFPHVPAAKYRIQEGLISKESVWGFAETADAAVQINRIVIGEFLRLKLPVASFAPLSFIYGGKIIFEHIQKALDIGIIPVVYGDVIMNEKKGFEIYSGEKILDVLAKKLSKNYRKTKIIYYTDTAGVYGEDGQTIPLITLKNFPAIRKFLGGSGAMDVTGGMLHKVEESLALVRRINAEVYIMSGLGRGKFTKIAKDW